MEKEYLIECLRKMKDCFDPVAPNYIEALEEAVSYVEKDPVAEVPCNDKHCGSYHPGWPNNCKAGRAEECGFYKPLKAKTDCIGG